MYRERLRPAGSTVGSHARLSWWRSTATAGDAMPTPSIRSLVHISRLPTTCAFGRLTRRLSFRNYAQFHGQVGTTNSGRGVCHFDPMKNCGAGGRELKRLPDVANQRKGSDGERRRGTRKLKGSRGCDTRNAAAIATRCWLKTCRLWAAPLQQSSTVLSSLPSCQVNWSSHQHCPPSTHMRCGRTSIMCGERGVQRPWRNSSRHGPLVVRPDRWSIPGAGGSQRLPNLEWPVEMRDPLSIEGETAIPAECHETHKLCPQGVPGHFARRQ